LLNPLGGFLLGAAADFADQDDAFGFRVVHEELDDVQVRRAIDGIAANADASGLAGAAGGQLPDRFVGESAATADDADIAPLMDVTGRNTNAAATVALLAFAGRDDAGAIRADEPRARVTHRLLHAKHVTHGNSLRDGDDQFQSGIDPFEDGVRRKGRRDKHGARRGARLLHRLDDGVEDGHLLPIVFEGLPALAGRDAGDDLGTVVDGEPCVAAAEFAGDALDEKFGVRFDEDGHRYLRVAMRRAFDQDFLRMWRQTLLPSGSGTIAMWQTGDSIFSASKFMPWALRRATSASRSLTSSAAMVPLDEGRQLSPTQPKASVPGPMSYSIHMSWAGPEGLRPSAPS